MTIANDAAALRPPFRPLLAPLSFALAFLLPAGAWASDGASDGAGVDRAGAIRSVLGLIAVGALAFVASKPRFRQWERALGLSQAVSAGLPFVAIGLLLRATGVISDAQLADLGALLRIALGWTGFLVGLRFRSTALSRIPPGVTLFVMVRLVVSVAVIGAATAWVFGRVVDVGGLVGALKEKQVLVLALAGSVTSYVAPRLLAERGAPADDVSRVRRVAQVEELVALVALLLVDAYFRAPSSSAWPLPGGAWALLALGLGVASGLFAQAVLCTAAASDTERVALSLGVVCFTSGAAGYLQISPLVVGFLSGALVAGLPGDRDAVLLRTLAPLDRTLTLIFLMAVGAYLDLRDSRGWLLLAAFIPARIVARVLGTEGGAKAAGFVLEGDTQRALVLSPVGSLGIAIVVNAHVLTPTGAMPSIAVAIVGAALLTELFMQIALRAPDPPPQAPKLREAEGRP